MQMQVSSINDVNLLDLASEVGYRKLASSLVISCKQYGNIPLADYSVVGHVSAI